MAEPDLIDSRKHDGTSLRYCSHHVPFEEECERCVEEALQREEALQGRLVQSSSTDST